MEQILRRKEMAEIILLPVRHHSPACAWHIVRMIEKLKPDAVLIEGPENAGSLIPAMIHEETKAHLPYIIPIRIRQERLAAVKNTISVIIPFWIIAGLAAHRRMQRSGNPR